MDVDGTDIRIIERLNADGRASLREIAAQLDLSPSTVSNRFHRLQEEGIIKGFIPVLDYEKMGFSLTGMIEVDAEADRMEDVAAALQAEEKVLSFFEVTGDTDIVMVCKFLDREDLNRFVKRVQKTPGVTGTKTNVVLTPPRVVGTVDPKQLLG